MVRTSKYLTYNYRYSLLAIESTSYIESFALVNDLAIQNLCTILILTQSFRVRPCLELCTHL